VRSRLWLRSRRDLRITTLVPTADTAQKAWIPSSGIDNFSRVAEIPPDDDTSYVASATAGDRDLYAMAPLGMTPLAIKGLQQTALARKDDAGDRALALVLKSGTEVAVASATVLGSSYAFTEAIHEQDPSTGEAWTPATVNAIEAGMEVAP
jgi:hypothetical protein